jgi:hypothetical protein
MSSRKSFSTDARMVSATALRKGALEIYEALQANKQNVELEHLQLVVELLDQSKTTPQELLRRFAQWIHTDHYYMGYLIKNKELIHIIKSHHAFSFEFDEELDNELDKPYYKDLKPVTTSEQLRDLLQGRCGMVPGVSLTEASLKLASETAFNAVIAGVIANTGAFHDPLTKLELPPKSRQVDFQSRGKAPSGRRLTYDEYLADKLQGWGEYTQHHLLASFWLDDVDRPLYLALLYQAKKEAAEAGALDDPSARARVQDEFFFRQGILTPGHLIDPPKGYERQVNLLTFIKKQEAPLLMGRRHDGTPREQ